MSASGDYLQRQQDAFGDLVEKGVYTTEFEHGSYEKRLVGRCLKLAAPSLGRLEQIRVLDCGCGTGAWLSFAYDMLNQACPGAVVQLYGFDITKQMVETARKRLSMRASAENLRQADVMSPEAYVFDDVSVFDLILTYDVIQQLPRALQLRCCQTMRDHLAHEGILMIFDQDSESPFGWKMGAKKFITAHLKLPLVPRYYCNAKYPPLSHFRRQLARQAGTSAEIIVSENRVKHALIVRRLF